ncbi:MAG: right-handed parallel beta-helix repeat-containing protein, partial [Bacteroidota bacterium]
MKYTLFLFIIILSFSCSNVNVNEYYIDAENGNDSNSGHSPGSAWQSLEKVNQTVFEQGDKILFKAGSSWEGQLEVQGSGSAETPIQINKYGEG